VSEDFVETLALVTGVFEDLGIDYAVTGSVACSVFGEPRAPNDIDVVAGLREADAGALIARLEGEFFLRRSRITEAVRACRSFSLIHRATGLKIDVFPHGRHPLDDAGFARRVMMTIPGATPQRFRLFSAEDIILGKLDRHRRGGGVSDREWRDVLGILKVQAETLDREYLASQASRLGVAEALARVTTDAGSA